PPVPSHTVNPAATRRNVSDRTDHNHTHTHSTTTGTKDSLAPTRTSHLNNRKTIQHPLYPAVSTLSRIPTEHTIHAVAVDLN
ncbi:hypothetical protein, partial [Bifidobacterium indicum]|uniref:hypothetical protein n=1 Tax=Bifidobacterium indicum TaxID=1691 RepID=UPI0030DC264B